MNEKELEEIIKCRKLLESIAEALEYILEEMDEESTKKGKYFSKTPHF